MMRRRFLAPEVIQTSATDCGPACLASFLGGFGIRANYSRLRDICFTDIDGTSVDDLEDVAVRFGLDAHQTMLPLEHLLHPDSRAVPAIVLLSLPGITHFVVLWRKLGPWIQLMDPEGGRRWIRTRYLRQIIHVHKTEVSAEEWRAWAGTASFVGPLSERMLKVGIPRKVVVDWLMEALDSESWRPLATLDAMTRMLESASDVLGRRAARRASRELAELAGTIPLEDHVDWVPQRFFSVVSDTPGGGPSATGELRMAGAVLITASSRRGDETSLAETPPEATLEPESNDVPHLDASSSGVLWQLLRYLRIDGLLSPTALIFGAALAGLVTAVEALLFKGLLDLSRWLHTPLQRTLAVVAVAIFVVLAIVVELRLAQGTRTLGRRLEGRIRIDFLQKLASLPDSYFSGRLSSDLAQRIHAVVQIRGVPHVGETILRSLFSLVFVTAGMIWLDPRCTPYVLVAALSALVLPIAFQWRLGEGQLAVATYQGGLSRFLLDALLGNLAIRAHGGEQPYRRDHERLLGYWADARRSLIRTTVMLGNVIVANGLLMSGIILMVHLREAPNTSSVLLLLFWSQQLPQLGRDLARNMMEYPARRAAAARLLECINTQDDPMTLSSSMLSKGAEEPHLNSGVGLTYPMTASPSMPSNGPEELHLDSGAGLTHPMTASSSMPSNGPEEPHLDSGAGLTHPMTASPSMPSNGPEEPHLDSGVALTFRNVRLDLGRSSVLTDLNLEVPAGRHVAIVGPSGAGKSSLLAMLLGFHRPKEGSIELDGRRLGPELQSSLRETVAWVDPEIRIWNDSLLDNITYGARDRTVDMVWVIEAAGLRPVIDRLPKGLSTPLGEGGGILSEGERQRVRLARALQRRNARLVLLDEPFRGLDRETRREYLRQLRYWWPYGTLLCVTHDVEETLGFDTVLVIEDGQIVEADAPCRLVEKPDSAFGRLLDAEKQIRSAFDADPRWLRWSMQEGRLMSNTSPETALNGRASPDLERLGGRNSHGS